MRTRHASLAVVWALLIGTACGSSSEPQPDGVREPSTEPVSVTAAPTIKPVVSSTPTTAPVPDEGSSTTTAVTTPTTLRATTTTTTTSTTLPPPLVESEEPNDYFITYQPNA